MRVFSGLIATFLVFACGATRHEPKAEQQHQHHAEEAAQEQQQDEVDRETAAQRQHAEVATDSFRVFFEQSINASGVKPRRYAKALSGVEVQGKTIVLTLTISDREEATKLCNFALAGWLGHQYGRFGIDDVQVVFEPNGQTLSRSKTLRTGVKMCQ